MHVRNINQPLTDNCRHHIVDECTSTAQEKENCIRCETLSKTKTETNDELPVREEKKGRFPSKSEPTVFEI